VATAAEERLKFLATVVALRRLARCLCDRSLVFGHVRAVVRELVTVTDFDHSLVAELGQSPFGARFFERFGAARAASSSSCSAAHWSRRRSRLAFDFLGPLLNRLQLAFKSADLLLVINLRRQWICPTIRW
jgi:hypothetical protein